MPRHLLLVHPSANRVYARSSVALTVAELQLLDGALLGGRLHDVEPVELAGVSYVGFSTDAPLDDEELGRLGWLSAAHALFEVDGELLAPRRLTDPTVLDDDLLTIPKYRGKTNETFTRLLLNVTAWAATRPVRTVLDPMCGRGTTLNQVLSYGWEAAGIEIDGDELDAYALFLTTWLQEKRLKHTVETTRVRREHATLGRKFAAELALSKEAWKSGDKLRVQLVSADTRHARQLHKPGSFDLVVTDAPYGVQHASKGAGGAMRRTPLELLAEIAPTWTELLRPGGAVGVAFNTLTAPREDVLAVLADAGLEPRDDGPYRELAHRVDRAIHRDVAVAVKAGS